jgi:hypothetical protein
MFVDRGGFHERQAAACPPGSPRGWNDERLAWLNEYRADASSLVAAAGQFAFVAGA